MSCIKMTLAVLLFASPAFAQGMPAVGAPSCGPTGVSFDVTGDNKVHAVPAPAPDKALVVFLQDDARFASIPRPTTRFGIDGNWVGATHKDSYFYVFVDPGEHHLCASWQDRVSLTSVRSIAALHFTAEAGKAYFFRAEDVVYPSRPPAQLQFAGLDSDEGEILVSSFSLSSSHPKK
jgi:hypothetical protein